MKDVFYMSLNSYVYRDIQLKSTNWDDAIEEVKHTQNYTTTKLSFKQRDKLGAKDYIEVYRNKERRDIHFDDMRDNNIYRKVY